MDTVETRDASESEQWGAVVARDASQDGRLYYGVVTTGIFCLPSCSARKPKLENVRFYTDARDALADGFRPCMRCRPLDGPQADPRTDDMARLCRHIQDHATEPLTLESLAEVAHMSPSHLQKVFRTLVGVTPREYAEACRLKQFRKALRSADSVAAAVYAAGYGSSSRAYEKTDGRLGMTPGEYRARGAGIAMSYVVMDSPLGRLLLAATDRGICFLQFGEDDAELLARLRSEYPRADVAAWDGTHGEQLAAWRDAIAAYLGGEQARLADLPVDVAGTAFQVRVWRYLQQIPTGEVRSYAQVAEGIGAPKAVRAVASACAANDVAIVIPCHRVIRGTGALGGYRWGLPRKQALLEKERQGRGTP